MKRKEYCNILSVSHLCSDVYDMWIESKEMARDAKAGQFASFYCRDKSRLLPRPISICEIDKSRNALRFVYRILGEGTREFATYKAGEKIAAIGPLGNGFPVEEAEGKRVFLIGGGIGIPPMVETAKQLSADVTSIIGFRDADTFLTDELKEHSKLYLATEDGSLGTKGNVIDAIRAFNLHADLIFACGPTPMLKALKAYAKVENIKCYLSLEEHMACGIGACLGCVAESAEIDAHSLVKNKRICKDGPVFEASEVEFS